MAGAPDILPSGCNIPPAAILILRKASRESYPKATNELAYD